MTVSKMTIQMRTPEGDIVTFDIVTCYQLAWYLVAVSPFAYMQQPSKLRVTLKKKKTIRRSGFVVLNPPLNHVLRFHSHVTWAPPCCRKPAAAPHSLSDQSLIRGGGGGGGGGYSVKTLSASREDLRSLCIQNNRDSRAAVTVSFNERPAH